MSEVTLTPHPSLDPSDESPHEAAAPQRIGRNVSATILARVGYIVTRIGIPPFVLAHMSLEAYGIWQTAFILVNYLGISTMGISNVYIKYIAEYSARRQYAKANELLSTGLAVTIPFCAVLFAWLLFSWSSVENMLHIPTAVASESKEAVLVVVAVFLASIGLSAFQDALTGAQEIALTQWFWVAGYLVEMVLIFVLVGRGRGIRGMAEAYLVRTLLNIVLCIVWSFRRLPWLRLSPGRFSRSALHSVFHFGGVVQLQTLLSTVINSIERVAALLLGMGVVPVGIFDLGKKWPSAVSTIPMSFFNAFLPAASHLHAETSGAARTEAIRTLYLNGARHSNLLSGYFCGLMALLPGAIMLVWLGPTLKTVPAAVPLFALFSVAIQIHMLTGPGTSILRGIGRIYEEFFYLLPNIVFILLTLAGSRFLLGQWTVLGVGSAVCLSTLLAAIVFLWRAHSVLHIPLPGYLRDVLLPGVIPYAIAAGCAWPATRIIHNIGRWPGAGVLIVTGVLYSSILAWVLNALILRHYEKQQWKILLNRAVSIFRHQLRFLSGS